MVDKVQHSPIPPGAYSVLASSTFAFTVCFAAWMMFAVLGIPIKAQLGLNETQFGLLTPAGADGFAGAGAAGHLDRPLRRPHRAVPADAVRPCRPSG